MTRPAAPAVPRTLAFDQVKRLVHGYEGLYNIPGEALLSEREIAVDELPALCVTFNPHSGKPSGYMERMIESMRSSQRFPGLVLFLDKGQLHLDDGHHRLWAARQAGRETLTAWVFEAEAHLPSQGHRSACASLAAYRHQRPAEVCRWCRQHQQAVERGEEIPEHPSDRAERELLSRLCSKSVA